MRLKNKKTGEIVEVESLGHEESLKEKFGYQVTLSWELDENLGTCKTYTSLAELNEEWTDAPKEPKEFYFIDQFMSVSKGVVDDVEYAGRHKAVNYAKKTSNNLKMAGNYFETKEEAEKAVEKLKAMAKLKESGFRFIDWELDMKTVADGKIWFDVGVNTEWDAERLLKLKPEVKESLDLLFGGGE